MATLFLHLRDIIDLMIKLKFRMFQTLHFQQRIKRIILIDHAARRCIFLMPQAATNGIEWLHSAFVFIRCTLGCIVYCINSSYSKYSLLKKASEPSIFFISVPFFPMCILKSPVPAPPISGKPRWLAASTGRFPLECICSFRDV